MSLQITFNKNYIKELCEIARITPEELMNWFIGAVDNSEGQKFICIATPLPNKTQIYDRYIIKRFGQANSKTIYMKENIVATVNDEESLDCFNFTRRYIFSFSDKDRLVVQKEFKRQMNIPELETK
jgi:hypothetical protein